jgi:hypothetical protein
MGCCLPLSSAVELNVSTKTCTRPCNTLWNGWYEIDFNKFAVNLLNLRVPLEQIELSSPPFDGISAVRFSPTSPSHLLVASWDTVSDLNYADRHGECVKLLLVFTSVSVLLLKQSNPVPSRSPSN